MESLSDEWFDHCAGLARVVVAFRAAAERPSTPLICAAFLAASQRGLALRLDALLACAARADRDVASWPSTIKAVRAALHRFGALL